jgi:DNA-binding response OmpR family regulator
MKARIFLVHWDAAEAEAYAEQIRSWGWEVSGIEAEDGGRAYRLIRENRPDALVIYLTRRPGHGRETARALRGVKATRVLPIVFVGGTEDEVAKVRDKVLGAVYVAADGLEQTLGPFARP